MKHNNLSKRLISAAVGVALLAAVLLLYDTPVLVAALAFVAALAVYELLFSTQYLPSKAGAILCATFAAASVFVMKENEAAYRQMLRAFWGLLMFCAIFFHPKFSFQQMAVCAFSATAVPFAISSVLQMEGRIYLILTCIAAWVADAGAFFIGSACGKRKLAPEISPNKTVEGMIGGLVCAEIVFTVICYGYWHSGTFFLGHAILVGALCAAAGMMGDLFASTIKRQTGIKDFGKIMPGHGGVMDRFDSFLFAAPVLYGLIQIFPLGLR